MNILIKKKRAFKGVSLPENKITAGKPIEILPVPDKVVVPLQQSLGAPCQFIVERGDVVKTGQKIADSQSYVTAPIHASISGKVTRIIKVVNPVTSTMMDSVIIESDGEDNWIELSKLFDIKKSEDFSGLKKIIDSIDRNEIIKKIREAGIVGLGGATFPTHVKLNPPKDKKIDTLILNGCECEPFITSDHRSMLENGRAILMGLYIISKILSPQDIYIAIEDNKEDAIVYMEKLVEEMGLASIIKIISLESRYPMGAEKTLIKTITGRTVPIGGLPMDVGVIMNNVATSNSVFGAVIEGKPMIDRIVTVTGAIENPKNLLVRLGTTIDRLIESCGKTENGVNYIIIGEPMMGISIVNTDFPVKKGRN